MLRQVIQPVVRQVRAGTRSYHVPSELKPPHMNELPVPQGSWLEHHNKHERNQNLILAAGIVIFAGTIAFGKATNLLYMNYLPPTLEEE